MHVRLCSFFGFLFLLNTHGAPSSDDAKGLDSHGYREKVFLHFAKDTYKAGERISFAIYLLNGQTHLPDTASELVYVDLIAPNDSLVETKRYRIPDTAVLGHFQVSKDVPEGRYSIRAYSRYMLNFDSSLFFRKSIYIGDDGTRSDDIKNSRVAIAIEPEGGALAIGQLNRIGVRITNGLEDAIETRGTVFDP